MALFHYCSNATFCSIIQNSSIRLSSLSMSNDTMEGKWLRGIFEKKCSELEIKSSHLSQIMDTIDFIISGFDGLGFCLSEAPDMLSQWRGYGADGRGVSIGFSKLYFAQPSKPDGGQAGFWLSKVNYGEVHEESKLTAVASKLEEASKEGIWDTIGLMHPASFDEDIRADLLKRRTQASMQIMSLFPELFQIKNPAFAEELEWRLLSIYLPNLQDNCLFRASETGIVPYREFKLPFDEEQIVEKVILGPKNTSRISDVQQYLRLAGIENVEVTRSSASYR